MNKTNISREPKVRRTDLHLRTAYLDLQTTIYRIAHDEYIIYADIEEALFQEIREHYERYIRPVTLRAALDRSIPVAYEAIVPAIRDADIPKNFEGLSMSRINLLQLLQAKFPKLNVYDVADEQTLKIFIAIPIEKTEMGTTKTYLSKKDGETLVSFVDGLGVGLETEIVETCTTSGQSSIPPRSATYGQALAPYRSVPLYQQRDEALWFDHIEGIYEGSFGKSDLYFYDDKEYCCYIDCSTGNSIDIRSFLLLYSTLIITPPFSKDLRSWLEAQQLSPEDLFYLIEKGRVRLLLTLPLQRYDQNLFGDIFNIAPGAIITDRAAATLLQTDISEIADNYFFAKDTDLSLITKLSEVAGKVGGLDPKYYFQMLTWPMRAKRGSFEALHWSGVLGTPKFGINTIAGRMLRDRTGKDREVEFMASASNIHIAHAMNATYFPYTVEGFSDEFYAHLMGNWLNLFKYTSIDFLTTNSNGEICIPEYRTPLNPVDILEVNDFIDIYEFEQLITEIGTVPKGIQLMEHLSKLSPAAREIEIAKYNTEVNKLLGKKKTTKNILDVAIDITLDGVGAVSQFDWIGTVYSGLKLGIRQATKSPHIRKLDEMLAAPAKQTNDQRHIHFLSQINRVAKIRRFR